MNIYSVNHLRNPFLSLLACALLWAPAVFAAPEVSDEDQKAGYASIDPPRPFQPESGKIEVVEFFWYGCPHCYRFEPLLQAWEERQAGDVVFRQLPAVLGKRWLPHARAYYIAESLGVLDQVHDSLFDRIHKEKKSIDKRASLRSFLGSHGVSGEDFDRLYESEEVNAKIQKTLLFAKRLGLSGVPAVVVNGKYLLGGRVTGTHEEIIAKMDELVARERQLAESGAP